MQDSNSNPISPLIDALLRSDAPDQKLAELCREHPEHADALRDFMANSSKTVRFDRDTVVISADPDAGAAVSDMQVGPYRLLDILGEGGMGTVYLAEQRQPVKRRVALKLIKLGMDSAAIVQRFEQERQALAVMDHEGIAKVFDCGTNDRGQPYFVMELVKGVPLDEFCERNRLSLLDRLKLMQQVCAAVQHAHQKGVIHRDLKPGNVLVGDVDGKLQVKIIDFGLAKAMGQKLIQESLFTEMGVVIGTPEYMAPEQADPSNLDIDTRADVYSLGVMLYELLVGELPLSGEQLRSAGWAEMQRVLREVEPQRPSTKLVSTGDRSTTQAQSLRVSTTALRRALKSDLDWVVVKALEKDRNRRYDSANALAADLQRFLDHEPLQAGPPSAVYRLQKLLRRHRGPVTAAALVLVAVIAGGASTISYYVKAQANAAVAERRADVASQSLDQLVYEAQRGLASIPHLSARTVRLELLRAARSGYEQLLKTHGTAPRPSIARVETQLRIAKLSFQLFDHAQLDADSERALVDASSLVASEPAVMAARLLECSAHQHRANVLSFLGRDVEQGEVLEEFRDAIAKAEALARQSDNSDALQDAMIYEVLRLSNLGRLAAQGLNEQALAHFRSMRLALKEIGGVEVLGEESQHSVFAALVSGGVAANSIRAPDEAEQFLQQAKSLGEALLEVAPSDQHLLYFMSEMHAEVGLMHQVRGMTRESLQLSRQAYEDAISSARRLIELNPQDVPARLHLSKSHILHAEILIKLGDDDGARSGLDAASEALSAARGLDGGRFLERAAKIASVRGLPNLNMEDQERGRQYLEEAVTLWRAALAEHDSQSRRRHMAYALMRLADSSPASDAVRLYSEALAMVQGFSMPHPGYGSTLLSRGEAYQELGQASEALEDFRAFVAFVDKQAGGAPVSGFLAWQVDFAKEQIKALLEQTKR